MTFSGKQTLCQAAVMPYNILLPQTFLPIHSVKLGRLVVDPTEPQSDYFDPVTNSPPEIIIRENHLFSGQESNPTSKSWSVALANLLSVSRSQKRRIVTSITTEQSTAYLLGNSGKCFQEALQDQHTKTWIEKAKRRRGDIYLVVGYHTVLNAEIYEGGTLCNETAGNIALPVAEALAATGIIVPFGNAVDPTMTVARDHSEEGHQSFTATGEQICAVQYRKLRFKWHSRRDMDDVPLGPSQWKSYWTFRGELADILEVDLQDDLELEGDNVTYKLGGEEFIQM